MLPIKTVKLAMLLLCAQASFAANAFADDLSNTIKLCDTDVSCSYGQADSEGGILFKIKLETGTVRLYCAKDGECARLYPRGQRIASSDPTSYLSLTRVLALK